MTQNGSLAASKQKKSPFPTFMTACVIVAVFVLVFILEQVLPPSTMLFAVLKKGATYALVAVSMNLLNGFTGLFSLGQAGFMLIGAYSYAILTIPGKHREAVYQYYDGGIVQRALPVFIGLILAGLIAAGFAWLIGLPVLRLKSDYLAIATLGFAEIIRAIFQWGKLGPLTNGSNVLRLFPTFNSFNITDGKDGPVLVYMSTLVAFLIAGICIALIVLLVNSTYGRAFKAIRDDEIAAEAMGIRLARHKMLSFVISSFFAGVGGGMLAMYMTTVQAKNFTSAMTYEILLIVVIGGIGSITGSIVSAFLFVACSEWWLRFLDNEMILAPVVKTQFVIVAILMILAISAFILFRHKNAPDNKRKRTFLLVGVADLLLVGWLIWFQVSGTMKMPLLRLGFRTVVFAVVIISVVLFFSRGIMGAKELPDLFRMRPSAFTLLSFVAIAVLTALSFLLLHSRLITVGVVTVLLCAYGIVGQLRSMPTTPVATISEGGSEDA